MPRPLGTHPHHCRASIILGAAMLVLAGCADRGGAPDEREGRYGGTVVIGGGALQELNPLVTGDGPTQEVNGYMLFMPLLRYTSELEYDPWLAEEWELTGDTGAVFHIRRDVRWHDGRATTAHDVAFTIQRVLDPETAFANAGLFGGWRSVEATDSFTVRVRFEPGFDRLRGVPVLPIVPEHLLKDIPPAELRQAAFNRSPVGNGPFRFVSVEADDRWSFEANPDFPEALGGRPLLDRVVWRNIPDATSLVTELRTGRIHLAVSPGVARFFAMDSIPGIEGIRQASGTFAFLGWNGRRPPLGDPRVRRALTMAIDREEIVSILRSGVGQVAVGPVLPGHWGFDPDLEPLPFAPDSARALLASAGVDNKDRDRWLELQDGGDFTIELKIPSGSTINRNIAEMVQADLSDIGIRLEVRQVDPATFYGDIEERNFQALSLQWEADVDMNLRDPYHSAEMDGSFQLAGYSNPEVDRLLDSLDVATSREAAIPILHRLQAIFREEQPWSYLYYFPNLFLLSERLRGVDMDIRGALLSVTDWWLAEAAAGEEGAGVDTAEAAAPGAT